MKWIKASERLPAFTHRLISRFIYTQTPMFDFKEWALNNPEKLNLVEWLDESQSVQGDAVDVATVREALADYMYSEGCRCCENIDEHEEAKARLGNLLGVEKYEDGSFNFSLYRSKENEP